MFESDKFPPHNNTEVQMYHVEREQPIHSNRWRDQQAVQHCLCAWLHAIRRVTDVHTRMHARKYVTRPCAKMQVFQRDEEHIHVRSKFVCERKTKHRLLAYSLGDCSCARVFAPAFLHTLVRDKEYSPSKPHSMPSNLVLPGKRPDTLPM